MSLRFSRQKRVGSYLAEQEDGTTKEVRLEAEVRRDPLTGRSGRVAHFQGFQLRRAELGPAIESSRANCPFCPERILRVTPKLLPGVAPGGRISQGEAVLFPNISPYDRHSVVVVLTSAHFVPPDEFRPTQLADGLGAAQTYFRAMAPVPAGTFSLVTWNYMPPAGATQVHAHLQAFSTDRPGSLLEEEVRHSRAFHRRHGKVFWEALLAEERGREERYLGAGRHTAWLVPFVSRSVISDLMAIFPGATDFEQLPETALMEFSRGLCAAMAFFAREGVVAFNLALYPAPSGQGGDHFWLHARLSPRIYFNPSILGSDTTSWQHLLDEPFMVRSPEVLAAALRPELQGILPGLGPK
jgi:galactose-1-phosphate uridylyltransferase